MAADDRQDALQVGPACKLLSLSGDLLEKSLSDDSAFSSLKRSEVITNGVALELLQFREQRKKSLAAMAVWFDGIAGEERGTNSYAAVASKLRRLKVTRAALLKDGLRDEVQKLLGQPFTLPKSKITNTSTSTGSVSDSEGEASASFEASGVSSSTLSHMAAEICDVEQELEAAEKKVEALSSSLQEHRSKLRNTKRKLARRDEKLSEMEEQADQEHDDDVEHQKRKVANLQQRVYYYQNQSDRNAEKWQEAESKLREVRHEKSKESSKVHLLEEELEDLHAQLEEVVQSSSVMTTITGGQYTDDVRKCCMELLSMNVGVWNVQPTIRSVLDMAGKKADRLPSVGLLSQMLVELKQVSVMQVAESLSTAESTTLHSDGTRKSGKIYGCYQIATQSQMFTVGMVDMKCGTAQHVLDKLKEVLGDVERACSDGGERQVAKNILKELKNTMSDRCIVEKKFNSLLKEYREQILPDVVTGWQSLTAGQQASISNMNNFFCGLHLIVGLADQANECLRKWEEVHFDGRPFGATELPRVYDTAGSRVFRLLRSTASAFEKHGNEQAGCMEDFRAYMQETGMQVPLAELRGNRSYVCFFNGAGVYFLRGTLLQFLENVHGETNLLLKAVKADLAVDDLIAGARALGILSKFVVTPLWSVLESPDVTIFDMSKIYTELLQKFTAWSADASPLLDGTARPFSSATVDLTDAVASRLLEPDATDDVTLEVLQQLSAAYCTLLKRLVGDHLPGGKYHSPSEELKAQGRTVSNTNAVSERDFAQLDRLLREKPCARTIALEGMIMFSNNRTRAWLSAKTPEERSSLFANARKSLPDVCALYKERQREIQAHRIAALKEKEAEIAKKRERDVRRKEELTQEVQKYGLWTSSSQAVECLASLHTVATKRSALRAQLLFRKTVLKQEAASQVFALSKGGKQHSVDELLTNLKSLLSSTSESAVPPEPELERQPPPSPVPPEPSPVPPEPSPVPPEPTPKRHPPVSPEPELERQPPPSPVPPEPSPVLPEPSPVPPEPSPVPREPSPVPPEPSPVPPEPSPVPPEPSPKRHPPVSPEPEPELQPQPSP